MATLVNAVASGIIAVSITGFIAMLQAEHSPLSSMTLHLRLWIKLSLAMVASGALMNVLSLSTPLHSEIVLNVGLAGLFSWAFVWHRMRWKTIAKGECR
jgi:hypothetical protein